MTRRLPEERLRVGAPLTHFRGLPGRTPCPAYPTCVGGPDGSGAYECGAGRARTFGVRGGDRRDDRRADQAAAGARPAGGHRLGARPARSGGGDLRGRADRLRPGPGAGRRRYSVRGRRPVEDRSAVRRPGEDRRPRRGAAGPAATAGRDRRRPGAHRGPGGRPGPGPCPRRHPRGSDAGAAPDLQAAAAHGHVYYGGTAWTGRHEQWLTQIRFDGPERAGTRAAYDADREALTLAVLRRRRLDEQIDQLAADSEFTAITRRLCCLRGISTLTGFALAVEIGDWDRFTGASIGAYLAAAGRGRLAPPAHLPDRRDDARPLGPGPRGRPSPR